MAESAGVLYLIGIVFLFILAVLWFFLPFAVFGIQPKMEKVIAEAKRTNELLEEIRIAMKRTDDSTANRPSAVTTVRCGECGKEYNGGHSTTCPFCGFKR